MERGKRAEQLLFATIVLIVLLTLPAFSYVDPGSGSLLLQATIAGALTAAFAVKRSWRSLKGWVLSKIHLSGQGNAD